MKLTRNLLAIMIITLAFSSEGGAAQEKEEPLKIGAYRQLFLDSFMIDQMEGVRRNIHPATKYRGNPVLTGDKPWESGKTGDAGRVYVFGSVERQGYSRLCDTGVGRGRLHS